MSFSEAFEALLEGINFRALTSPLLHRNLPFKPAVVIKELQGAEVLQAFFAKLLNEQMQRPTEHGHEHTNLLSLLLASQDTEDNAKVCQRPSEHSCMAALDYLLIQQCLLRCILLKRCSVSASRSWVLAMTRPPARCAFC
jgi:hypothetical protein